MFHLRLRIIGAVIGFAGCTAIIEYALHSEALQSANTAIATGVAALFLLFFGLLALNFVLIFWR